MAGDGEGLFCIGCDILARSGKRMLIDRERSICKTLEPGQRSMRMMQAVSDVEIIGSKPAKENEHA